jgi:hypothetical protein
MFAGGMVTESFGFCTAGNDVLPDEGPVLLSRMCFAMEVTAQVLAIPWIATTAPPDCTTEDGTLGTLWIVQGVGVVLDGGFLFWGGRLPENTRGDAGVLVTFIFGLGHIATAIVATVKGKPGAQGAVNILPAIAEIGKILRLKRIIVATEGWSLPACAGLDVLCYTATAVILIALGAAPSSAPVLEPATEVRD